MRLLSRFGSSQRSRQPLGATEVAFFLFLVAVAVCGGASRADASSLIVVRIASVLLLAHCILKPPATLSTIRPLLGLLIAFAGLMIVQLIPLPANWWAAIPGRAELNALTGSVLAATWRPINLVPDAGWNSLLALLPPLAALIGFARLSSGAHQRLVGAVIVMALASATLGTVQYVQGENSGLYLYAVTNRGSAVGLLANRNHQGMLLALAIPALACWATFSHHRQSTFSRSWLAAVLIACLAPVILITGSRSALIAGAAGTAVWPLFMKRPRSTSRSALQWLVVLSPLLLGCLLFLTTIIISTDTGAERLLRFAPTHESRVGLLPTLLQLAGHYMPFGAGFGAFDPAFRHAEPFVFLQRTYLNHAHDDLLELIVEGGVPAILVLAAFLLWLGKGARRYWQLAPYSSNASLVRLGITFVLLLLGQSLFDYPLRTPLLSVLFSIACGWITLGAKSESSGKVAPEPASIKVYPAPARS